MGSDDRQNVIRHFVSLDTKYCRVVRISLGFVQKISFTLDLENDFICLYKMYDSICTLLIIEAFIPTKMNA